jgi:signal transduction histidine kinase
VGGLAIVYSVTARLGLSVAFPVEQVSPVWPPTGIALVALFRFGHRLWPGVTLGAFAANALAHEPLLTVCGIATGNTLEALVGAWLLRRSGFQPSLERVKDTVILVLLGAASSTIVSATIGATSLCLTGLHPWSSYGSLWFVWWLGDAMGDLLVAPVLFVWATWPRIEWKPWKALEGIVLFTLLLLITESVFVGGWLPILDRYSMAYVVFPFVICATLRFGQRGTVLVTFISSFIAILGTAMGSGPFGESPVGNSEVQLQVFQGVVAITGLVLASAMTERKKVEKERGKLLMREHAARLEAEHANRMKDQFLANLSHELRTPLNVILGWAHLLKKGKLRKEEAEDGIEVIERNARNQARLIEELLDMSRIISGKIKLELEPIEIAPLIAGALEGMRPAAGAKAILLQHEFAPQPGPILGDPTRLQQVVSNLLSNAIKFTPRGGRVILLLKSLESHLEISICDTGNGIRTEFLPHVFERFRQADSSSSRQYGGLGLGLPIVRHLVEAHQGKVWAESAGEGTGTTFVVQLPRAPLPVEPPLEPSLVRPSCKKEFKAAGLSPYPLKGIKVLVVDDEVDSQDLVKRMLEDCQAEVTTAGSAAEAMEILKQSRPHVLVSDIAMPQVDGYALIRRVKSLFPGLPALALTAYASEDDRRRALEEGFLAYVPKPVEGLELLTVLAEIVGKTA